MKCAELTGISDYKQTIYSTPHLFTWDYVKKIEKAKHTYCALPDPLSCFVINKICLNHIRYFIS